MRYSWLALGSLLLWQTAGWAQQSPTQPAKTQPLQTQPVQVPQTPPAAAALPPQPALDPAHNPLDAFLINWEASMKKVDSLLAENCSRTEDNKTFQVVKVYVGKAEYVKPNLAMLEMYQKNKPEEFEKFVLTGTTLYVYKPQQKEIQSQELPASGDNFLSFLFGMKAEDAKRRYDLKLAKDDQWYVYIDIGPRLDQDKADFRRARMVLNKDNFMVRQLWFEQANSDTVTWDFPKITVGARLNPTDFAKPTPPQGWKLVPAPRQEQPVIRGQGGKP
jgi:TIGR03009 family protein